jgi:hypothetical protein
MSGEAIRIWLGIIAAVAVLFWLDFRLGIVAIAIIVGIFILTGRMALNGFPGS